MKFYSHRYEMQNPKNHKNGLERSRLWIVNPCHQDLFLTLGMFVKVIIIPTSPFSQVYQNSPLCLMGNLINQ